MNARQGILLAVLSVVAVSSIEVLAQGRAGTPAPAPAARPAVATVGTRPIAREDWERRCAAGLAEFSRRSASAELPPEVQDLVRRQVLESQIRIELLVLEARRTGVTASPLEAEEVLKQDPFFNPGGTFDESRFLAVKTQQVASFNTAIAALQEQIAARKLNARVEARVRPPDDSLRRAVAAHLARASLEHLSLRRGDFEGTYAEPREQEVLDWYASHRDDYRRPDRASLTVVFVNAPGLSDSARALPGGLEAWTARMKAVADSLLGRVREGATLEEAAGFLGPRPNTVVTSDNFPGYWRAGAELNRRLFEPGNVGRVLPQALPAAEGWLLVRVDQLVPAHVAPLAEVAREIRGLLRRDRRTHHEEYELRALYARLRDSLAAPGWRFRVAIADTGASRIAAPTAAEIDRYYRGRLADYSAFDPRSGGIVSRPLAEVRDEVLARWYSERRRVDARLRADGLLRAWRSGKRDAKLEAAAGARDLAPSIRGSLLDAGAASRALSDTVWSYPDPRGPGLVPLGEGWAVWKAIEKVDRAVPTFEQARPLLARRLADEKAAEEEAGARRLFDENASRYAGGDLVHFSRFPVSPRRSIDVPLSRAEVEKYHRDNLDRYSAPELVTARHILVAPADASPEADAAARARAADLLRRARAGDEFARLAREHSDDEATREQGGDLGTFGRGTMVDAFERVVFSLPPGELAPEPVRTPLGYHVIQVTDYAPAVVHNLDWVYTIVGGDAARAKAMATAAATADSLTRVLGGGARARAYADRLGLEVQSLSKPLGESSRNAALARYFALMDQARPGEMVPRVDGLPGTDFWVTWVDSVAPAGTPTWERARAAALDAYRRGAAGRALDAKKDELDSLFAAGWSLDSVAALWGGLDRVDDAPPGRGLPGMGGGATLDSLVFDRARPAALAAGGESGWVEFPNGWSRVRLLGRSEPPREQLLARLENERAAAVERGLVAYFDGLKKRWPVRILDPKMRGVAVAQPPPPGGP